MSGSILIGLAMIAGLVLLTWAFVLDTRKSQKKSVASKAAPSSRRSHSKVATAQSKQLAPRKPLNPVLRSVSSLLALVVAACLGGATCAVVFFAPAWLSGDEDILLWWLWFGGPLGLALGGSVFVAGAIFFPDSFYEGFGGRFG